MRAMTVVLLAAAVGGCHSWRVREIPSPGSNPGDTRVTLRNGTRMELHDAVVGGDSIQGFAPIDRNVQTDSAVAKRDVQLFEVRRLDPLKTGALFLGVAAPFTLLVVVTGACFGSCN